ncbi:hypothetical protein VNO77_26713 [Canavalia gladiata]|uniref:Uncharacterized protein n=1 Tax=Canavalia gladiata TaxID=3824 RepID=A0AAN9KVV3_CANGL
MLKSPFAKPRAYRVDMEKERKLEIALIIDTLFSTRGVVKAYVKFGASLATSVQKSMAHYGLQPEPHSLRVENAQTQSAHPNVCNRAPSFVMSHAMGSKWGTGGLLAVQHLVVRSPCAALAASGLVYEWAKDSS